MQKRQKGLRISSLALLLVIFKRRRGSERFKVFHLASLEDIYIYAYVAVLFIYSVSLCHMECAGLRSLMLHFDVHISVLSAFCIV